MNVLQTIAIMKQLKELRRIKTNERDVHVGDYRYDALDEEIDAITASIDAIHQVWAKAAITVT